MSTTRQFLFVALVLSLAIDGFVYYSLSQHNNQEQKQIFGKVAQRVVNETNEKLRLYAQGLSGTRGAVAAVGPADLTHQKFKKYIASRDLFTEFPGAHGFGFVQRVKPTGVETFLRAVRRDGQPEFKIRQLASHDGDMFVIKFIEPETTNAPAIGMDIASEPNRAVAALESERTDMATLTPPVTLTQNAKTREGSLLFLLPVFTDSVPPATESERIGTAFGWVYAPLFLGDVMSGLDGYGGQFTVSISDATDSSATPIHAYASSDFDEPASDKLVEVIDTPTYGRVWRYEIKATPKFIESLHLYSPLNTTIVLFLIECLVLGLIYFQVVNRQQSRKAHEDKENLAAIVDSSSDAIIGKTIEGVVTSWNHAAEVMFGYSRHEAIGKTLASLIFPEELQHEEVQILKRLSNGEVIQHFETIRHRKDGTRLHVSAAVAPVRNEHGQIIGASKTVRDITRQKEAENEVMLLNANLEAQVLERTKELNDAMENAKQASRSKAEFLANMSHEIRSPMNAVLGMAYLAEKQTQETDTRELVQKIIQAGHTLLGIINDILDFSKIEEGHLELELATFRLPSVLDNLSTIMGTNLGNKDLELVISPPPKECEFVKGDALRLEQILINLISNAIKFTDQGHVLVSVRVVADTSQDVTLRFVVQDTGVGIPLDKQEAIFTSFTQADTSITRQFGGTGLGLAIAKQLVELMGGEIGLTSAPGYGSEFWFTVTLSKAEDTTSSSPEIPGLNVLIADDNELALDALVQISHQLGWKTNAVQDGQQAIDYALAQPDPHAPDVVIVDWKMPIKDGIEVTKTIREHYKGKAAPIFVMATAFSREQLNATNGADLIDVVLSKPVTASSLYDAVSAVMKKRGKQDESASTLAIMASTRLSELAILVVDDSEINRDLAKRIFLREGAQVVTANHGEEAVSILNKSLDDPFDIVIMDVQMPIMDGLEATKRIRENPLLASLPVIALTAGAFTTQKEAALSSGMNAVMTKPFNVDKLVNLILELTKKGPVASADKTSVAISEKVYLDRDNGIAIWGDEVVYQRYLNRFSDDYHFLLTEPDTIDNSDFAGTLHKLKGATSNLGLTVLADAAGKFEQTVQLGKQSKPDFSHFRVILSRTFDEIKRYTASRHSETVNQVKNSISQLEMELDSDNPDKIWPIMAELEQLNASEQLTRIREHVEKFEFRKAELCLAEMKSSLN